MSLQALIPPCAQTEWLRFTGTIEKRSTLTPSSASLIVHASPASPPPTTMTRFFGAAIGNPVALRFLSYRGTLLVQKLQVMLQMLAGAFDKLRQRALAVFRMRAGSFERRIRK